MRRAIVFLVAASATFPFAASAQTPAEFVSTQIGRPAVAGSAHFVPQACASPDDGEICGRFVLLGAGTGVDGSRDQVMFVHRQLAGDGEIVAQVSSLLEPSPQSSAGLMVRESLSDDARYAFVRLSPSDGVLFQYRDSAGERSVAFSRVEKADAPVWLKLERRGSTLTAYRSADGGSWRSVGSVTASLPLTLHVGLAVTSEYANAGARATFSSVGVLSSAPAGWTSADVGQAAIAGTTAVSSGQFVIGDTGSGIGGTRDQFRYVFQQVSGDLDIVARLTALRQVSPNTKAGLMVRASLAADASHASVFDSSSHAITFERRREGGSTATTTNGGTARIPVWLKLEKRGSVIDAFHSTDGKSWTSVGRDSLTLPGTFYIGLSVSSDRTKLSTQATLDNVSVTAVRAATNAPPQVTLTSPQPNSRFEAGANVVITATATDPDGSIEAVEFFADGNRLESDTAAPYSFTWTGLRAGSYRITATARDNKGATTTSAAHTITVRQAAPPPAPAPAPAPTPVPAQYRVAFLSTDHATLVNSYVVDVFVAGANAKPVRSANFGKPALTIGEVVIDFTSTVQALSSGTYYVTVTAVGAAGSATSAASPTFTR